MKWKSGDANPTEERAMHLLKNHKTRNRAYALDDTDPILRRYAAETLRACTHQDWEHDEELFYEVMSEATELGYCNALKPAPIPEPEPIILPKDPVTGERLPNYFETGDRKGQEFLFKFYPEAFEYFKNVKERGPAYIAELELKGAQPPGDQPNERRLRRGCA
jgi:hypothetical protein